jgi:outer membrane receptor protein involved in Fe transport
VLAHVSGRVIDALGHPVRGATVAIQDAPAPPVKTDRDGFYRLSDVPAGATLVIDHEGFETGLAVATKPVLDEVVLLTEQQASETIEVKSEAPPEAPGAAKIDRADIQRVPGTGGDLVRTLTAMPGIVNSPLPTGFSGVVIRGSAPEDSKILVDGFEVPLLYHTIAFRSILPVEAIDTLDYIPGGFGVEYGRAASGIVALTTRIGSDQRSEQAEISALDGGALAQGSAGKDTHYMLAFRRSTIDLILPYILPASLDLSLTTVPYYYDLQGRVDYDLSPAWRLTFSTIGSQDTLEIFGDKSMNADKRFYDDTRFIRFTGAAHWHDGPWTASLALSEMPEEFQFEAGSQSFIDIKRLDTTLRGEVTRTGKDLAGLLDPMWRIGAEADVSRYGVDLALPQAPQPGEPGMVDLKNPTVLFNGTIWTPDFAAWSALTAGLGKRVRATASLRVDGFAREHVANVQPRGELSYKLGDKTTARLSAGAYRRPAENQEELLHSNLQPEQATQVIVGVQHEPREGVRIQTSLYYTDRSDLITMLPTGQLGNEGRGTTYGAELLATARSGPWFAWLSYSYSHSTRIDYPGAPEHLFAYDQPHSLNASGSWKHGRWQLGARFELYSGLPYTPVLGSVFDSDRNFYTPIYGPIDSERAPLHHQLDLRIDHTWHPGPVALTGFIDVQNVYLNESVVTYTYSYDYSQRIAFKSIPIIPSIGVRGVL